MNEPASPKTQSARRDPLHTSSGFTWGAVLLSVLICAAVSWIHFQQRQTLERSAQLLQNVRQARVDLAKGFLHVSLAGDPGSPFSREQGLALLDQTVATLEAALQSGGGDNNLEPGEAETLNAFHASAVSFRAPLTEWRQSSADRPAELLARLRIAFGDLERQAERVDAECQRDLERLVARLDSRFTATLAIAALLLAGICVAVLLAARAREKSEAALAAEAELRRSLFAQSPDGILIIDPATARPVEFNDAAHRQLGYTREEFARSSIFDLEAAETPEQTKTRIQTVLREGTSDFETRQRTRSGEIRDVHVTAQLIQVQGRDVYYCVWRDITGRKRAETASRESEERLNRILETVPDGIAIVDLQGRITFANPGAESLLGLTRKSITQRTYNDPAWKTTTVDGQPFPEDQQPFASVMRTGKPAYGIEQVIEHPDGRRVILSINAAPLRDATGALVGMVAAFADITERKQAERNLRESEARYRTLFTAMQEGFALHELICDDQGQPQDYRYLDVNPAFEQMTGISRERWIGHTVREVLPQIEGHWIQNYGEVALTGVPRTFENYVKELDQHYEVFAYSPRRGQFAVMALNVTERKRAKTELELSHDRYRQAIVAAGAVPYQKDYGSDTYVFMAEGIKDILGCTAAELRSSVWREIILETVFLGDAAGLTVAEAARRMLAGELKNWRADHRIRARDGKVRWISDSSVPLFNAGGKYTGSIGIIQDITERKQAEAAIRESEARLALAQRVAHLGSWELDLSSDELVWSEETYRIFGASPDTFTPTRKTFLNLVHPEDRARMRQAVLECVRTGRPYQLDHRIVRPDGSERVVSERADVILDAAGNAVRLAGTVQDVTELKRAEQALQRSERHFRSIIESVQDVISIVDAGGVLRFVSPSVERLLGHPPEHLLDRNGFEFIHPEDVDRTRQDLRRALQNPDLPTTSQYRFRHADGSWRLIETVAHGLESDAGPVLVLNSRDITDSRRLEEQLRQSQKMEAIGQLAAGVAHDFNNLLTVIRGNASLLDAPGLSEEDRGLMNQIIEAAERAAGLTRQLLMFSRKQVMRPADLDLNEIVGNMTKMLQRILGEDVMLRSEYAPSLPLVHADAGMLEQVLLNLAVNARDAMPHGGELLIRTAALTFGPQDIVRHADSAPGPHVRLSVSDTGCGIPPENLQRIFDPFFTTKEVGKGTGLGLATVYGIVRQHRGWVEVESEVGNGTVFHIHLPAVEGASAVERSAKVVPPLPRGSEVLLVVEDEPAVRLLVNNLLQRCGYTVLLAESGVAALEVWRNNHDRVDLLLTDMVMPDGLSGRELADRLQREKSGLKVIFTSGYSATVGGLDSTLVEGVNFLQKPYPPHHLAKTVRDCLDRQ